MPDPRFYHALGPATLGEIATISGSEVAQPQFAETLVHSVAPLGRADAQSVTFFSDRKFAAELAASGAGACFVPAAHVDRLPQSCVALVTRHPQYAYAAVADRLHRPRTLGPGAVAIDPTARLEDGVVLLPGVVIGHGATIGRGTYIGPNTVIGPGVTIGRDCAIGSNVTIGFALIGDRVKIYAGVVIGEPGFGAAGGPAGVIDIPQLGRVILQDKVTLGANSCVDRGAYDDTVIGEDTKIDNFVQIAHNVVIGRSCVIAAHTGISGSCVIGDGVQMGGRVGMADHLTVGSGARLAANTGLMHNVPAGETWAGVPAVPIRRFMRQVATLARLTEKPAKRNSDGA